MSEVEAFQLLGQAIGGGFIVGVVLVLVTFIRI